MPKNFELKLNKGLLLIILTQTHNLFSHIFHNFVTGKLVCEFCPRDRFYVQFFKVNKAESILHGKNTAAFSIFEVMKSRP